MYRKRCIYYYKIIITNSFIKQVYFRKGEKSITLQEFISKKEKESLKIYNLLEDDIEDGVVYQIHREIRGEEMVNIGLFRQFSNLLYAMKDDMEVILAEDE